MINLLAFVPCQSCRRPASLCVGNDVCEGAAKAQAAPYKQDALEPYTPGLSFRGRPDPDYRAETVEREPTAYAQIERMAGSFCLAYVVRNEHGTQMCHSPRERTAWAGACGMTRNSRYDQWRALGMEAPRK